MNDTLVRSLVFGDLGREERVTQQQRRQQSCSEEDEAAGSAEHSVHDYCVGYSLEDHGTFSTTDDSFTGPRNALQFNDGSSLQIQAKRSIGNGWFRARLAFYSSFEADQCPKSPLSTLHLLDHSKEGEDEVCQLVDAVGVRALCIALRHGWIKPQIARDPVSTTAKTQRGVDVAFLSRTIRDAIKIARTLSLGYVWIDACCPAKDLVRDWSYGVLHMVISFRKGLFISAGTDVPNRDEVFFWNRSRCDSSLDGNLPAIDSCGNRSWIPQVQLLSRNLLSWFKSGFARNHYSHCNSSKRLPQRGDTQKFRDKHSQGRNVRLLKEAMMHGGKFSTMNIAGKPTFLPRLHAIWQVIVMDYTTRQVSQDRDRLVALRSICDEIMALTGEDFVMCMWRRYIYKDLLWFHDGTSLTNRGCTTRLGVFDCLRWDFLRNWLVPSTIILPLYLLVVGFINTGSYVTSIMLVVVCMIHAAFFMPRTAISLLYLLIPATLYLCLIRDVCQYSSFLPKHFTYTDRVLSNILCDKSQSIKRVKHLTAAILAVQLMIHLGSRFITATKSIVSKLWKMTDRTYRNLIHESKTVYPSWSWASTTYPITYHWPDETRHPYISSIIVRSIKIPDLNCPKMQCNAILHLQGELVIFAFDPNLNKHTTSSLPPPSFFFHPDASSQEPKQSRPNSQTPTFSQPSYQALVVAKSSTWNVALVLSPMTTSSTSSPSSSSSSSTITSRYRRIGIARWRPGYRGVRSVGWGDIEIL